MNLNLFCLYEIELQDRLASSILPRYYQKNKIINRDKYLFGIGNIPILLVAHLDTVHIVKPSLQDLIFKNEILSCLHKEMGIGADDRAGVCAIIEILQSGWRPSVLFCQEEEIGCVGAKKAGEELQLEIPEIIDGLQFMIELDRCGREDAVFYDCGNKEFQKMILSYGFEENYGSFSDISELSPAWDLASVNLSIGYSGAHTKKETLDMIAYRATIDKVKKILSGNHSKIYDYQELRWDRDWLDDYNRYYNRYRECAYGGSKSKIKYSGYSFFADSELLQDYYGGTQEGWNDWLKANESDLDQFLEKMILWYAEEDLNKKQLAQVK